MRDLLNRERKRVDSLLGLTSLEFEESETGPDYARLGAAAGWRLRTIDAIVEIDTYIFDDLTRMSTAVQRLMEENKPDPTWELPAVGQNGKIVFVVHYLGSPDDSETAFEALGVVSALSGEEE